VEEVNDYMKLELNIETIRELSNDDLEAAAGGMSKITENLTQSPACPSGATWFASCETRQICP
jgi:hypothetical protein